MWTILVLFILWVLSIVFYLPVAVVLILFAALISGTTVTITFALARRKALPVAQPDTNTEFLKKAS